MIAPSQPSSRATTSARPEPAAILVKASVRAFPPVSMLVASMVTFGCICMYSSYRPSSPMVPNVVTVRVTSASVAGESPAAGVLVLSPLLPLHPASRSADTAPIAMMLANRDRFPLMLVPSVDTGGPHRWSPTSLRCRWCVPVESLPPPKRPVLTQPNVFTPTGSWQALPGLNGNRYPIVLYRSGPQRAWRRRQAMRSRSCLLYTSDAADEED